MRLAHAYVFLCGQKIELLRKDRDVFVVGCTNVGKSTLINRLISITMKGIDVVG